MLIVYNYIKINIYIIVSIFMFKLKIKFYIIHGFMKKMYNIKNHT